VLQLANDQPQTLQQNLNQLSTGLRISDQPTTLNPNQNVLSLFGGEAQPLSPDLSLANAGQPIYLQTSPLQQSVLQLFGGQPNQIPQQTLSQSGVAQLSQANQSQQSVLQLFNGQSDAAQQNQQNTLQLLGNQDGSKINSAQDNPAGLQLADQTQQRLSTGLRINQNPPSLIQFLQNGLHDGGALAGDPNKILLSSRLAVLACYADQNGGLQILNQDSLPSQPQQVLQLLGDSSGNQVVSAGDLSSGNQLSTGRKLDFFALGDNAAMYSAAQLLNADGLAHRLAEAGKGASLNSPYLFLEFQNLWGDGGQSGVENTLVLLNAGQSTVNALLATPEPAMPLTFAACLGLALLALRRNQSARK